MIEHVQGIIVAGVIINIAFIYFNRRLFLWDRVLAWVVAMFMSAVPFVVPIVIAISRVRAYLKSMPDDEDE